MYIIGYFCMHLLGYMRRFLKITAPRNWAPTVLRISKALSEHMALKGGYCLVFVSVTQVDQYMQIDQERCKLIKKDTYVWKISGVNRKKLSYNCIVFE